MSQISTSVKQTTEVVALSPAALTLRAASRVPVHQDMLEMELLAQVCRHLLMSHYNLEVSISMTLVIRKLAARQLTGVSM